MIKTDLLRLVQFDPDQLRKAIQAYEEEADALSRQVNEIRGMASLYGEILRTHGFKENKLETIQEEKEERSVPTSSIDRRFRRMKIAEAIVTVLKETGGKLHAQKILKTLGAGGLKVGGKYPMGTLVTAMRRDRRIEKDPRERNTWRLRHVTE